MTPPLTHLLDGRIVIGAEIGRGGMAVVYRSYDVMLEVERAVKVLSKERANHPKARRRFIEEARAMAGIRHPGIVHVHDVIDEDDVVAIVMELIEGCNLGERLNLYGALPPRDACRAMAEVLRALHAAHEAGIVHRDVKPHNILITADDTAKLTDFGIAHREREGPLTRPNASMGTREYMAPEQRERAGEVDGRADVYAAGATLYALVANLEPLDLFDPQTHAYRFDRVPSKLTRILIKACRREPGDRYASALEMAEALEAVQESLPQTADDAPPLYLAKSVDKGAEDWFQDRVDKARRSMTMGKSSGAMTAIPSGRVLGATVLGGLAAILMLCIVAVTAVIVVMRMANGDDVPSPAAPEPVGRVVAEPALAAVEPATDTAAPPRRVPAAPPPPVVEEEVEEPPAAIPSGSPVMIKINSRPWSEVFINGSSLGTTGYVGEIAPGNHALRLVSRDGKVLERQLVVHGGQPMLVCWDFDLESTCL